VGLLDGKVAVITGAGRGIGRAEALLLASEGAKVVVNDLGGARSGEGNDSRPAQEVVDEIKAAGGDAAANYDDIASWQGGQNLIQQAVDTFGGLDIVVNNAGILRDKMSFNMDESDWDAVINVHLKGHFVPSRFAAAYWRARSKETGAPVNGKIINTASESGLYGNAGQLNYAAAKAGIAAMTIVLARELERIGVRVNAIAPVAMTRLTEDLMGGIPDDAKEKLAPENVAAVVAWLASDLSDGVSGQVVKVQGGLVQIVEGWHPVTELTSEKAWTIDSINEGRDTLFAKTDPGVPPFMKSVGA
jgi:NAD(P)-dependent dehydrogenase (short-subunit alcohol dehydrogenase family)